MTSANPNVGKYRKEPTRAQRRRWLRGGAGFFLIANHGVQCIANFVMDYLRHLKKLLHGNGERGGWKVHD